MQKQVKAKTNHQIRNLIAGLPEDSPPPPDESSTQDEPLKGNYFHKIKDGKLLWQGVILRQWGEYVLILTFEWLMGSPSCRYLIKISDLVWDEETKTGFYLYGDHHLFERSYEEGMAHAAQVRNETKS
jgi:hypothetical protein